MSDGPAEPGTVADTIDPAALAGMTAVMTGRFALYRTATGGMEMFYDIGDGTQRKSIPRAMVEMMTGDGRMAKSLRRMLGERA